MCILNETLNVYKIKICKGRFEKKETICYSPWISKKTRIWLGIAGTPNLGLECGASEFECARRAPPQLALHSQRSSSLWGVASWLGGACSKVFWWIVCSSPSLLRRTLQNPLLLVGSGFGVSDNCAQELSKIFGGRPRENKMPEKSWGKVSCVNKVKLESQDAGEELVDTSKEAE